MSRVAFSSSALTKKSTSPVIRGKPWKPTAWPPTTRYSTDLEFNNSTNSRMSFARRILTLIFLGTGGEFEYQVESLLRLQ